MAPRISIVIPAYNVVDYVEASVRSILDQTVTDIEVIGVDDGSTDGTGPLLDRLAAVDARFRVIHQDNRGLGAARNVGAREAQGEWLYFFDSDDLLVPTALEELLAAAADTDAQLVYFDAFAFSDEPALADEAARMSSYYERSRAYGVSSGAENFRSMQENGDWRPSACLQFFKHSWYRDAELSFPEGILHEDNLFSVVTGIAAPRVAHLPRALFERRMRSGSITTVTKSVAHLHGLIHCARGLATLTTDDRHSEPVRVAVLNVIGEIHGQAVGVYEKVDLPITDLLTHADLSAGSLDAQDAFALSLYDRLLKVRRAERRRRQAAEKKLKRMTASRGYRLVTLPRRALRRLRPGRSDT